VTVKKIDQSNRPTRSPEDPFAAWDQDHLRAHEALREKLFEELNEKTERCEASTRQAICAAETTAKLGRLRKGIEEWTQALCDAVASFYPKCAKLLSCNSADLAEYQGTPHDLARDWTVLALGYFLGMPDLDGNAPNPDSRVRGFIGHACGIYPNDIVESPAKFQLPSWARRSTLGDRIAGLPVPSASNDSQQAEYFIQGTEKEVASAVLDAIDKTRTRALRAAKIAAGMKPSQGWAESELSSRTYRTPYEGLKPDKKVVDYSNAMLAANLTDKQYDCYSLAKEYNLPMSEIEQRMGITRKTIHEHLEAAQRAFSNVRVKELRVKAAAKHRRPD
jgi:hypothetical protein